MKNMFLVLLQLSCFSYVTSGIIQCKLPQLSNLVGFWPLGAENGAIMDNKQTCNPNNNLTISEQDKCKSLSILTNTFRKIPMESSFTIGFYFLPNQTEDDSLLQLSIISNTFSVSYTPEMNILKITCSTCWQLPVNIKVTKPSNNSWMFIAISYTLITGDLVVFYLKEKLNETKFIKAVATSMLSITPDEQHNETRLIFGNNSSLSCLFLYDQVLTVAELLQIQAKCRFNQTGWCDGHIKAANGTFQLIDRRQTLPPKPSSLSGLWPIAGKILFNLIPTSLATLSDTMNCGTFVKGPFQKSQSAYSRKGCNNFVRHYIFDINYDFNKRNLPLMACTISFYYNPAKNAGVMLSYYHGILSLGNKKEIKLKYANSTLAIFFSNQQSLTFKVQLSPPGSWSFIVITLNQMTTAKITVELYYRKMSDDSVISGPVTKDLNVSPLSLVFIKPVSVIETDAISCLTIYNSVLQKMDIEQIDRQVCRRFLTDTSDIERNISIHSSSLMAFDGPSHHDVDEIKITTTAKSWFKSQLISTSTRQPLMRREDDTIATIRLTISIVFLIFGGVAFLLLMFLCRERVIRIIASIKSRKEHNYANQHHHEMTEIPPEAILNDSLETTWEQLSLAGESNILNDGTFSRVIVGRFDSVDVAIKVLQDGATPEQKSFHLKEIIAMKRVKSVCGSHPNVVELLSHITDKSLRPALVMELCSLGSLLNYLHQLKRQREGREIIEGDLFETFISYAKQICSGMDHLASNKLLHRDLAARHVLVCHGNIVKITHFTALCHAYEVDTENNNYLRSENSSHLADKWRAPEVLSRGQYTTANDVWAFGVVLWEIFNFGAAPYCLLPSDSLLELLQRGYRLEKPSVDCPSFLYAVMNDCWQINPDYRPNFTELQHKLQQGHQDVLID